MHSDYMPIVLVSAKEKLTARNIISEIIDQKICIEDKRNEDYQIWHLKNKYYQVDVKLVPNGDDDLPPSDVAQHIEAHVIYLTDDENEEHAERRRQLCAAMCRGAQVRLAMLEASQVQRGLAQWAARRRYEPVALRPSATDNSDDDESDGIARARDALHAHTWRGLVLLDTNTSLPRLSGETDSMSATSDAESSESWGEWESWAGEGPDRLTVLVDAVRAARAALAAPLDNSERRRRAELVLDRITGGAVTSPAATPSTQK